MSILMNQFKLQSPFAPGGDQPAAIAQLVEGVNNGETHQVLLGVTGSGKTFTVANVIEQTQRPTLIMAPNKTLAAQLYSEFKELFPDNAVEYFVSYYDYYQPEAYVPARDLFIEKDTSVNEAIDRLRHAATHALLTRRDVIVVASVSCIYGLGSPESYKSMRTDVDVGQRLERDDLLKRLIEIQYERNDIDFHRGTFRVRGDVVEIYPAYKDTQAIRIEFFGDEVERIVEVDPLTGELLGEHPKIVIFPNSHYVAPEEKLEKARKAIHNEMGERIKQLESLNKLVEAQRIQQRTEFDLELLEEIGFCKGIENYARYLDGRQPGEAPLTLIDYFPDDFLMVLDESHLTVPQVGAMYKGDRARKETLVEFGFRLPSALDNRPMRFDEFESKLAQCIHVSATPADYELKAAGGVVAEQIVRPTGLLDPVIEIRPVEKQVVDLLGEVRERTARGERVLVTTLTKRMAEDLSGYYQEQGVKVRYLHSDIDTLERTALLRDLRLGVFDVLVGINLLREGLDLPEVSLVAILDADKEGFLRSARSLIQTFGRAARNADGKVICYADKMTDSLRAAIDESERRRAKQIAHNEEHGIVPRTVKRAIRNDLAEMMGETSDDSVVPATESSHIESLSPQELAKTIKKLRKDMLKAAEDLDFETAAQLRDQISRLQQAHLDLA